MARVAERRLRCTQVKATELGYSGNPLCSIAAYLLDLGRLHHTSTPGRKRRRLLPETCSTAPQLLSCVHRLLFPAHTWYQTLPSNYSSEQVRFADPDHSDAFVPSIPTHLQ